MMRDNGMLAGDRLGDGARRGRRAARQRRQAARRRADRRARFADCRRSKSSICWRASRAASAARNLDHRLRRTDFRDEANDPLYPALGCSIAELEQVNARAGRRLEPAQGSAAARASPAQGGAARRARFRSSTRSATSTCSRSPATSRRTASDMFGHLVAIAAAASAAAARAAPASIAALRRQRAADRCASCDRAAARRRFAPPDPAGRARAARSGVRGSATGRGRAGRSSPARRSATCPKAAMRSARMPRRRAAASNARRSRRAAAGPERRRHVRRATEELHPARRRSSPQLDIASPAALRSAEGGGVRRRAVAVSARRRSLRT